MFRAQFVHVTHDSLRDPRQTPSFDPNLGHRGLPGRIALADHVRHVCPQLLKVSCRLAAMGVVVMTTLMIIMVMVQLKNKPTIQG